MARDASESPDDGFFNDLSQQGPDGNEGGQSPPRNNSQDGSAQKEDAANKPKRIACVLCRKRKLRCDGARPTCGTCKRLSHDCAYDEVRKKSGPKRGYVKLLEARLQQVETLLKNQESSEQNKDASRQDSASAYVANTIQQSLPGSNDFLGTDKRQSFNNISPGPETYQNAGTNGTSPDGEFPWEMIGLGLDEPLPPQDVQSDLYQIYFTKIHSSIPVIHRPRFLAAMNLAPSMRPPVCLRYAMWTMAASLADKYDALHDHFYQRARKYAQMDEMRGHGESTITLAHCQMWILLSTYEFKQMYFPRAWLSCGRAVRLAQMMQLHRMDGAGLDVKQCLPPPKDWTEREERRRTFWMAFCIDRYASIGTGWPMTIDERDIMTHLPSSEEAFEKSKPMVTATLEQTMAPNGVGNLTPFGGIVLTSSLFGRNLLHLHRPGPDDNDDDLNGGFWTRHRKIENVLLQTALSLPDTLRLPTGLSDPNVIFMSMSLHTSAICLHQAAIFKADKHRLPTNISNESKIRCVTAAAEIASVMRMISHMDLAAMNPFISFCVYVAARVFVQYLKTRPNDQQINASLQFLLQAMQALRKRNPLTESFLVQLDLDLESAGVLGTQQKPYEPPMPKRSSVSNLQHLSDQLGQRFHHHVDPIFEIRDAPTQNPLMNQYATQNRRGPTQPFSAANGLRADMEPPGAPFIAPPSGPQLEIPSRDARGSEGGGFSAGGINMPRNGFGIDGNEMDITPDNAGDQPSPATTSNSQSRGTTGSHTSYSPGHHIELQYRPSPKTMANQLPVPQSTGPAATAYSAFSTSDDIFSAMYAGGAMNGDGLSNFVMGNEWDMPGMATGAGMTPMSEGAWNQMLETMNVEAIPLGWDAAGPPHNAGPRAS